MSETINIFISYSHRDEGYKTELLKFLAPIERVRNIKIWSDFKIRAGEEWNEEIHQAISQSTVIIALISSDFLASEYINEHEVPISMEKHKNKSARVIPVLIRPCIWDNTEFAKLQGLPKGMKSVSKWSDKDSAYEEVAREIDKVIGELSDDAHLSGQMDHQGMKNAIINSKVADLEQKKQIYLAVTADELDQQWRKLFAELKFRRDYEDWPFEVVPNPVQVKELKEMNEEQQQETISNYMDQSLFSIHLIDADAVTNKELIGLQYHLAKDKCSGTLFKCLLAVNDSDKEIAFFKQITERIKENPNFIKISRWNHDLIIDSLDSLIEENERQKESLKNRQNLDKSILLLYDYVDSDNQIRGLLKSKLEKDYQITVRQTVPIDFNEEGFNRREFEQDELQNSDGVILLYGKASSNWCITRQSTILREKNIGSKMKRGFYVLEPDKEKKIRQDVNTKDFIILGDVQKDLDQFVRNL